MVVKRSEMKVEKKERMRDGEGTAQLTYLLDASAEKNARMFAEVKLEAGSSIGYHAHDNETEYYFIVSGNGSVNDNGTETPVAAGDSVITGGGASHSIKNTGTVPLIFHAVIVTY
jgi:mannose-6-phosphate isomerase-like protein (cupin superfamily)